MRLAAAAILEQERQELAGPVQIDRVDDRAALFARGYEPRAGEDGEVGGHGVARHVKLPRDVARRRAGRSCPDEQAEHLEPALLRQGAESTDRSRNFHMSRIIDIL